MDTKGLSSLSAKTTQRFNALRRNGVDFEWTQELEKDFIKLKENNTRSYPEYSSDKPFTLTIDFSALAMGVTLTQEQKGQERLIAAAGRWTTPGEKN